jgi:hypothetical protein
VPNDDLHGVAEGDEIQIELRNPKAFLRSEHAAEPEETAPTP